ncbi:MAG: threonine dehydratase [bacterium]|nr:threonine dehydratase [bacterium]
MSDPREPTIADIYQARKVVSRFLRPTPLLEPFALSRALGFEAWLKCDNLQPVGAFKVRGGLNLVSQLDPSERRRGVITASTGNHGQSIAYAARAFGCKATIAAPEGANPFKVAAMRQLGADVVIHGRDFDEAREWAETTAGREGLRYVHACEPPLIAGVATAFLEVLEEVPDLDYLLVPIGGGSGCCAACIVATALNPSLKVIGVQAERAPAVYRSWREGRLMATENCDTFADGLATRVAQDLPLRILRRLLTNMVLVSEEEMREAIVLLLETAHQVAEGAGAAATAAAMKLRGQLEGRRVGLMLSGGNITGEVLRQILAGK